MIYGIPVDTLVSVVVWTVAAVMLIPAVMGIIVIVYDIIEWRKQRK